MVCATSKGSDLPAPDQSICLSLEYSMIVKLLTGHRLKEGCIGSSKSTLVKMSHCWKPHVTAHLSIDSCWLDVAIEEYG